MIRQLGKYEVWFGRSSPGFGVGVTWVPLVAGMAFYLNLGAIWGFGFAWWKEERVVSPPARSAP